MTKKQKDMLKRILVTAVLYVALVAADHMKMIPAVFEGSIYRLEDAIFVSHPLFCDRLGYPL